MVQSVVQVLEYITPIEDCEISTDKYFLQLTKGKATHNTLQRMKIWKSVLSMEKIWLKKNLLKRFLKSLIDFDIHLKDTHKHILVKCCRKWNKTKGFWVGGQNGLHLKYVNILNWSLSFWLLISLCICPSVSFSVQTICLCFGLALPFCPSLYHSLVYLFLFVISPQTAIQFLMQITFFKLL